jgi:hypothetical protein
MLVTLRVTLDSILEDYELKVDEVAGSQAALLRIEWLDGVDAENE